MVQNADSHSYEHLGSTITDAPIQTSEVRLCNSVLDKNLMQEMSVSWLRQKSQTVNWENENVYPEHYFYIL